MRVERFDNRNYAFGLDWVDASRKPGKDSIKSIRKRIKAPANSRFYTCVCQKQERYSIGAGTVSTPIKGRIYSYAASLAMRYNDGLFVARVDDVSCWFVLIRNGLVIPGTDVIDSIDAILENVAFYRENLNLPDNLVFSGPDLDISNAEVFNPEKPIAGLRRPVILTFHSTHRVVAVIGGGAVIAAVLATNAIIIKHRKQAAAIADVAALQIQQSISTYRHAVKGALSSYSIDGSAGPIAWRNSIKKLPHAADGWTLHDLDCDMATCSGDYVHGQGVAFYSIERWAKHYGNMLSVHPDASGIRLRIALNVPTVVVNDQFLRHPPKIQSNSLIDFVGLSPLHVAGLSDRPAATVVNEAASSGGLAAGYPSLVVESITIKGRSPIDIGLMSVSAWAIGNGFHLTHLTATTGYENLGTPSWTITAIRVHG